MMKADLTTIKDLVELDVDRIPPMLVAPNMQQGIVNEWNELKDYGKILQPQPKFQR